MDGRSEMYARVVVVSLVQVWIAVHDGAFRSAQAEQRQAEFYSQYLLSEVLP